MSGALTVMADGAIEVPLIDDPTDLPLDTHPTADIWPMRSADELNSMADSIRARGLRDPITIWRDPSSRRMLILDGRNRLAACQIAGVKPTFVEYDGEDPDLYVLDKNADRRHLGPSQRAMAVALTVNATPANLRGSVTAPAAAVTAGVSTRLVEQCRYVITHQPQLIEPVLAGTIKASAAAAEAERLSRKAETEAAKRADALAILAAFPDLDARRQDTEDETEVDDILAEAQTRTITAADRPRQLANLAQDVKAIAVRIRSITTAPAWAGTKLTALQWGAANGYPIDHAAVAKTADELTELARELKAVTTTRRKQ